MNFQSLMDNTQEQLAISTKLTDFTPGSIARGLLEVYNAGANEVALNLDTRVVNAMIATAVDKGLDEIGKLVNVPRIGSKYALGYVTIRIDSATGKSLDDLLDMVESYTGTRPPSIVLPVGTEVTTENENVVYTLISDVTLADTPVTVDVLSRSQGPSANVPSGALTKLRITNPNYSPIIPFILCSNQLPIDNGSDAESDDNYRFRISNAFNAAARANETAIRLAALSVPGVADVVILPYEYGIGTTGVFVISEAPIVSQGLLNAVKEAMTNVLSVGEKVNVSAPHYRAFSLNVSLQFKPSTSTGQRDTITKAVQENIINYVNNLPMGAEIVINEIRQIIMDTSEDIYDHQLIKMGIGDYNLATGLIDYFEVVMPINQVCAPTEKYVTNKKLITVCC